MAEDLGLTHLRSVALDFIVHNFAAVSATEAYGHLSKAHMHQVAMEAAANYSRVHQLVRNMSDKVGDEVLRPFVFSCTPTARASRAVTPLTPCTMLTTL